MWNLKTYNRLVNIAKKKQTHRYSEETNGCKGGEEGWQCGGWGKRCYEII